MAWGDFAKNAELEREVRFNTEIAMKYRDSAIKTKDFAEAGVVPAAEVARDEQEIHTIKHSPDYKREQSVEAVALEYAILKLFDDGEFGDVVKYAQKAAEYDDLKRGIDIYVDLGDEGEVVPLGIDVTTSMDERILMEKIARSRDVAKRGELTRMKYFFNGVEAGNDDQKKKYLTGVEVPRIILGLNKQATSNLQTDLLSGSKQLERKYVRLFLEQIASQLEMLIQAAPPKSDAAKILLRTAERLEEIYKEKDLKRATLKQVFGDDPLVNPEVLIRRAA